MCPSQLGWGLCSTRGTLGPGFRTVLVLVSVAEGRKPQGNCTLVLTASNQKPPLAFPLIFHRPEQVVWLSPIGGWLEWWQPRIFGGRNNVYPSLLQIILPSDVSQFALLSSGTLNQLFSHSSCLKFLFCRKGFDPRIFLWAQLRGCSACD